MYLQPKICFSYINAHELSILIAYAQMPLKRLYSLEVMIHDLMRATKASGKSAHIRRLARACSCSPVHKYLPKVHALILTLVRIEGTYRERIQSFMLQASWLSMKSFLRGMIKVAVHLSFGQKYIIYQ